MFEKVEGDVQNLFLKDRTEGRIVRQQMNEDGCTRNVLQ